MMNITVICVGKLKEKFWREAYDEYAKRLGAFCKLNLIELEEVRVAEQPSPGEIRQTVQKEGEKILSKIPRHAAVVALCIEGSEWSSRELADFVARQPVAGISHLVFIIGGSYGLSDRVKQQADIRLSFSKMTFPHQLFRILLLEQIYRAFQIGKGSAYHK